MTALSFPCARDLEEPAPTRRFVEHIRRAADQGDFSAFVRDTVAAAVRHLVESGFCSEGDIVVKSSPGMRGAFCVAKQAVRDPNGDAFLVGAMFSIVAPRPGSPGECRLQVTAATQKGERLVHRDAFQIALTPESVLECTPAALLELALHEVFGVEPAKTVQTCGRAFGVEILEAMTP